MHPHGTSEARHGKKLDVKNMIQVEKQPVYFYSDGNRLAGILHIPEAALRGEQKSAAIIITGSLTTVKEQMAGGYAPMLAQYGYVTLVFDHTGFGKSEGQPREYEAIDRKVRDIRNAVSYLQAHPAVDENRIAGLGICTGSSCMALAAAADRRLRSLASIVGWFHNCDLVTRRYGGDIGVRTRMEAAAAARKHYTTTGEVEYVPACSKTEPRAAMYGDFSYFLDPGRGAIDEWSNRFAVMSWTDWLTLDPIAAAPQIRVPTVLVHSKEAALPDGARKFFAGIRGSKDLHWFIGSHFDFYDRGEYMAAALEPIDAHFASTLQPR